ncbi:btk-binding protein-related [Anaeramoeba flamelloides]|uniref:Btk-binding protein-related n=1 Tax=Anaeramoeba flamelloides TaxID=1746091 RepID=A0AAV8A786_9EUKA|nr:btk-binding protein-related [Anaeramoeba flamelloides]
MGCFYHFLVWYGLNKLQLILKNAYTINYELENEEIIDIVSSCNTYFILTKSKNLYSIAKGSSMKSHKKIPFADPQKSTFEKLRKVTFFEEKNLVLKEVTMCFCTNYYLCENGCLYASGYYNSGLIGISGIDTNQQMPVFLNDNTIKIFSNSHGWAYFYITKGNELYSSGKNSNGQLGQGDSKGSWLPKRVILKRFEANDILDIWTGHYHSILLTKDGRVYTCGHKSYNGHDEQKTLFTELPEFKEKNVIKIAMGEYQQIVLTDENEFFAWGSRSGISTNHTPKLFTLPESNLNSISPKAIQISSGLNSFFIYNTEQNTIYQDFRNFFESKKFTDFSLGNKESNIKCHKAIVEFRAKQKINDIQNIFVKNSYTTEEINCFLKWVYFDEISNNKQLEKIITSLDLSFPPKNNLEKDLLELYKNEDSKDFVLLVKDVEYKENEDNNDDDGDFKEIPVHKFILLIRSGLFRGMFDYVNEKDNTNKVQDYTNKSIKSLEILIKYFYTDEIELTNDDDPSLIVEELEDSIDYYQLNEYSTLSEKLKRIKQQQY